MGALFKQHYTLEQARELLPNVRHWLEDLRRLRARLDQRDEHLTRQLEQGMDAGGPVVNRLMGTLAEFHQVLREFQKREIQIKDLERGLVDFPAFLAGKEVFLCWEKDEADIEYWHDLEAGYAGRERLQDD